MQEPCEDVEFAALTSQHFQACTDATRKAVHKGGGSCALRKVLKRASAACCDADTDKAHMQALRKLWKRHLKSSVAWRLRDGFVSAKA